VGQSAVFLCCGCLYIPKQQAKCISANLRLIYFLRAPVDVLFPAIALHKKINLTTDEHG
jgi:hypothetical protein